jgi:hypothetical protein
MGITFRKNGNAACNGKAMQVQWERLAAFCDQA